MTSYFCLIHCTTQSVVTLAWTSLRHNMTEHRFRRNVCYLLKWLINHSWTWTLIYTIICISYYIVVLKDEDVVAQLSTNRIQLRLIQITYFVTK